MRDGVLVRDGDDYVLRFERDLSHPIERVWQAVTDRADLAAWFPSTVDLELRVGAPIVFGNDPDFDVDPELLPTTGAVVELEPMRRFAFTWGSDLLRFELSPTASGCRMVFTHRLPHRACANRTVSGWSVCLDALTASMDGVASTGPGWRAYYDRYVGTLGDDGSVSHEDGAQVLRFERLVPAPKGDVASVIAQRWPEATEDGVAARWQLIPVGDTSLVLLTLTTDRADRDLSGELTEWDVRLRGLADSLA